MARVLQFCGYNLEPANRVFVSVTSVRGVI